MALSDFWEIKDHQTFLGKPILNVYHVKRLLAGANAVIVTQAFIDFILEAELLALQPVGVGRTTIDVANLGDVTDFASSDSSTLPGQRLGQQLPGFNAVGIQLNRTRTDIKNGYKRFLAGDESDQLDSLWLAAFVTEMAGLATALVTPWERDSAPGIDVCELAVLKRFCIVPGQDPCTSYRLPDASEIDGNHYVPSNTVIRVKVRSQVSRKLAN